MLPLDFMLAGGTGSCPGTRGMADVAQRGRAGVFAPNVAAPWGRGWGLPAVPGTGSLQRAVFLAVCSLAFSLLLLLLCN